MKKKLNLFSLLSVVAIALAGTFLATTAAQAADMTLSPNPVSSTGTPVTGTTVTVNVGTWDAGVTLTYSWYRDSTQISGATTTSYTPVSADLGTVLKFNVTATKAGFTTISKDLTFIGTVVAPMTLSPTPTISGTFSIGGTLTAVPGTWDSGVSLSYQWRRSGGDINGATSSTYVTSSADAGYTITVVVTGSKAGFFTTTRVSNTYSLANGTLTLAPAPIITGVAQVGEYLSVSTGTWDEGVTFTYQWQVNGYNVSGATNSTYQVQYLDLYDTIRVQVTGSKTGFNPVVWTTASTVAVKAAVPKVSWVYPSTALTGKSVIIGNAARAFGGTTNISKVCLTLDGKAINLPVSSTGIQFYNESDQLQSVDSTSSGCYSSYWSSTNFFKFKLNYDVTGWTVGNHTVAATATDYYSSVSLNSEMTFAVAYTGPVVTVNPLSSSAPVVDAFSISGSSSTHSANAPIKAWCITVDGAPLQGNPIGVFKNSSLSTQDVTFNSGRTGAGCFDSSASVDLRSASITLDSKLYANGSHSYSMRTLSGDGSTTWWSLPVTGMFTSKNAYIPTIEWGAVFSRPVSSGKAVTIGVSVSANIPGDPSLVVFSVQNGGSWTPFARITDDSEPSARRVFAKNAVIQVEIFDEDNKLVLTETQSVAVVPVVSVGSPSVTVKNSTSGKAVKTLRYNATISTGVVGTCTATWSLGGASGKTTFSYSKGKGSFAVNPSGKGTGKLSIVCGGSGLTTSNPYVVSMRVP